MANNEYPFVIGTAGHIDHGKTTLVKRLTTEKKEREPSIEEITHKLHAHIAEEELAQSLGRGVKIVAGRKKGRIELDYYDMDDLNDLLDALGTLQQRKNGGTKK